MSNNKKVKILKIEEQCPYCDQQVEINATGISECSSCGKWICPCSMCDMDKVDCNNCGNQKIANNRNKTKEGEFNIINSESLEKYFQSERKDSLLFDDDTIAEYIDATGKYKVIFEVTGDIKVWDNVTDSYYYELKDFTQEIVELITTGDIYESDRYSVISNNWFSFTYLERGASLEDFGFLWGSVEDDVVEKKFDNIKELKIGMEKALNDFIKWYENYYKN